jgi:hypothetical protein
MVWPGTTQTAAKTGHPRTRAQAATTSKRGHSATKPSDRSQPQPVKGPCGQLSGCAMLDVPKLRESVPVEVASVTASTGSP